MAQIQVVIVTPEETTFDEMADSVVVPMIDGEAGILPGYAPTIGRLSAGELRVTTGGGVKRFYVDGGFVQIADNVVSVLPGVSIAKENIDVAAAKEALAEATAQVADNEELVDLKERSIAQAKAQIRIAGNG